MPVSSTVHCSAPSWAARVTVTWPASVNLSALLIRFPRICRSRTPSSRAAFGSAASSTTVNSSFFFAANGDHSARSSAANASRPTGASWSTSRPASSFERSSRSSMSVSISAPLERMVWAISRSSSPSGRISSASVMPSTPFIGVRISWPMLAKKALLVRSASRRHSSERSRSRPRACTNAMHDTRAATKLNTWLPTGKGSTWATTRPARPASVKTEPNTTARMNQRCVSEPSSMVAATRGMAKR